jgi:hypothetical protein
MSSANNDSLELEQVIFEPIFDTVKLHVDRKYTNYITYSR